MKTMSEIKAELKVLIDGKLHSVRICIYCCQTCMHVYLCVYKHKHILHYDFCSIEQLATLVNHET